jgi:glycosyltransferase involved in cell wall biosynthesis
MANANLPGESGPPLVTIITACYNAAASLEAALRSVRAQTYPNIEHIVIDGGSKDATVDIIRRYQDGIAHWVSERDKGIADAWNKGLAKAKGRYIATLNADDVYDPGAVAAAVAAFAGEERCVVYGVTHYFESEPSRTVGVGKLVFNPSVLEYGFGFMHTTCFVPKRVYDEIGGFDLRYRIAIDTDWLLRCHYRGIPFRQGANVTHMRTGGLSHKRWTEAYLEYLRQLYRQGYPRWKLLKALLVHFKLKLRGRYPIAGMD